MDNEWYNFYVNVFKFIKRTILKKFLNFKRRRKSLIKQIEKGNRKFKIRNIKIVILIKRS